MSDDQVECEWVSVSSVTGLPGLSRTKAVNRLCVYVFFLRIWKVFSFFLEFIVFGCILHRTVSKHFGMLL